MSKLSRDFLAMGGLVERGFDRVSYRYQRLTAGYRVPLAFSRESMETAAEGPNRLRDSVRR